MAERWLLAEPGSLDRGAEVVLDPAEARHLAGVLRRRPGDRVVLADGAGTVASGRVVAAGRGGVRVEILEVSRHPSPDGEGVRLALAVLHTEAMDRAVRKAVEVGVTELVPVITERTQLAPAAAAGRSGRWRRVARQALKQCRRPWAMAIGEPVGLDELIRRTPAGAGLVAEPDGSGPLHVELPGAVTVLVGPEGGLTTGERGALERAGWRGISLGRFVLRAETAAIVAASLLGLLLEGARRAAGGRR